MGGISKKSWVWLNVLSLTFVLAACSSSPETEDDEDFETFDDDAAFEEAETDEVPDDDFDSSEPPLSEGDDLFAEDDAFDFDDEFTDAEDDLEVSDEADDFWGDDAFEEGAESVESDEFASDTSEASTEEDVWTEDEGDSLYDQSGYKEYTVQEGDTLMKIAYETYGDVYRWREILDLNQDVIDDYQSLVSGQVLQLEASGPVELDQEGEPYLIQTGDTLGTISYDVYGTEEKWERLWDNNRQLIQDPDRIYAGFYLYYIMTAEDEAEKERLTEGAGHSEEREPAQEAEPNEVYQEGN